MRALPCRRAPIFFSIHSAATQPCVTRRSPARGPYHPTKLLKRASRIVRTARAVRRAPGRAPTTHARTRADVPPPRRPMNGGAVLNTRRAVASSGAAVVRPSRAERAARARPPEAAVPRMPIASANVRWIRARGASEATARVANPAATSGVRRTPTAVEDMRAIRRRSCAPSQAARPTTNARARAGIPQRSASRGPAKLPVPMITTAVLRPAPPQKFRGHSVPSTAACAPPGTANRSAERARRTRIASRAARGRTRMPSA